MNPQNPTSIILRIITYCSCKQSQFSIIEFFELEALMMKNVISKLVEVMREPDFSNNILDAPDNIVQMDETVLNYKCKNHQGRLPHDRIGSLCIVEFKEKIIRSFACVKSNKEAITWIPIITRIVANYSII
ncbi:hypothetical protein H312_01981 [Anncaliia algerae PRA339]|uniref:Uncharacterized protein n=1 Tax=Anncaliia algerae PRA339 TaxID=1288291 RepID=A0A059F0X4_9MICR|nr:hypothetical protein H312_01981 [Anncaliia algerae PRA339]